MLHGTGIFICSFRKNNTGRRTGLFGISRDGFPLEAVNDGARVPARDNVPFVADSLASGKFVRSDASFSFPYGYKHGTILPITEGDYERIKTRTGQITDISKIAVRLMEFSYKKNCGRLPCREVPAAAVLFLSFPTKPIRSLFVLADSTFSARLSKCIVLMVSEIFFISVPVQRFATMEHAEDAGLLDQLRQAVENDGIGRPHNQVALKARAGRSTMIPFPYSMLMRVFSSTLTVSITMNLAASARLMVSFCDSRSIHT